MALGCCVPQFPCPRPGSVPGGGPWAPAPPWAGRCQAPAPGSGAAPARQLQQPVLCPREVSPRPLRIPRGWGWGAAPRPPTPHLGGLRVPRGHRRGGEPREPAPRGCPGAAGGGWWGGVGALLCVPPLQARFSPRGSRSQQRWGGSVPGARSGGKLRSLVPAAPVPPGGCSRFGGAPSPPFAPSPPRRP